MLLWFAGRRLETLLSDGLVWQALRLLLLESPRVSKLCAFQMLLKSVSGKFAPVCFCHTSAQYKFGCQKAWERETEKR